MKKIEKSNFSLKREFPLYIDEYVQRAMADHPESDFNVSYRDYGLEYGFEEEIGKILEKKKWVDTYQNRGLISKLITDIVTSGDSYDFPKKLNYSESDVLKKYTAYQKDEITRQIKKDLFRVKYAKEFVVKEIDHLERIENEKRELNSLEYEINEIEGSYSSKGKKDLLNLDPIEFEHYVAKFFERKGYDSIVTSASNDGGYDIVLTDSGSEKYLVQCKRYIGTVSSPELRNFLGTLVYNNVEKGFVVTTGTFSAEAKKIASSHNITLVNGKQLGYELASKKYQESKVSIQRNKELIETIKQELKLSFFNIQSDETDQLEKIIRKKKSEYEFYKRLTKKNYLAKYDYNFQRIIEKLDGYVSKKLLRMKYPEVIEYGGVTESQLDLLKRFFTYENGKRDFVLLEARYPDTMVRIVKWKPTGKILDKNSASKILSDYFNG